MEELKRVLDGFEANGAEKELANWGGWWRNRYRENRDKARRVLAELNGMIRERRVKKNPSAVAVDLWGRLPK